VLVQKMASERNSLSQLSEALKTKPRDWRGRSRAMLKP